MDERYIRDKFIRINDGRHQRQSLIEKKQLLEKQQMILDAKEELIYTNLLEEQKDVEELEKMTFSSIVNDLLESKVEKLAKEQEDLYVARLQYEKLKSEKKRIANAIFDIDDRLQEYVSVEAEYEELLKEIVSITEEPTSEKIQELHQMFTQAYNYEKEKMAMREVVSEGEWLITEVNVARENLEKAKSFWEKTSEGNVLSAIKEYKYIDEAQITINKIQWGLRKFHNALNRIKLYNDEEVKHFLSMPDEWIRKAFQENSFDQVIESFTSSLNLLVVEILDINKVLRQEISQEDEKIEGIQRRIEIILRES
jgi:hypothetical protein